MKITLTVEDFKRASVARQRGGEEDCHCCIVAQALKRTFPEATEVVVGGVTYILDGRQRELSHAAADIINRYDNGDDLTEDLPMTLEMDYGFPYSGDYAESRL
jgi:hypothetical protein